MFLSNFIFYLVYLFVFTAVAYNKKDEQVSPWAPPTVENTPVLHSPGLLNLLPQLAYTIEHTFWGYLYVSGQLLTALANGYFFIVGVRHLHPPKTGVPMSRQISLSYPKKWIPICRFWT